MAVLASGEKLSQSKMKTDKTVFHSESLMDFCQYDKKAIEGWIDKTLDQKLTGSKTVIIEFLQEE